MRVFHMSREVPPHIWPVKEVVPLDIMVRNYIRHVVVRNHGNVHAAARELESTPGILTRQGNL